MRAYTANCAHTSRVLASASFSCARANCKTVCSAAKHLLRTHRRPGIAEHVRLSYYSCNGVQHVKHADKLEEAGGTWKMWDDLAAEHSANPFHVLLGGGDDIYMDTDSLWSLPELEKILYSVRADRNTEVSICSAVSSGTFWRTCTYQPPKRVWMRTSFAFPDAVPFHLPSAHSCLHPPLAYTLAHMPLRRIFTKASSTESAASL